MVDITSLRSTLDELNRNGELLTTDTEINPENELAAIQKHFDGALPVLFNRVKGYPEARLFTNLFANEDRIFRLFGADNSRAFKAKCIEALHHPIPPKVVKNAPCQEIVIDKNVDVWPIVPMISHTPSDPGRTLGGGNTVVTGKYFWGGNHIGFNRMNFRTANESTFQISPGSHCDMIATEFYHKEPIPMTINMGVPPACTLMAGSGFLYMILPKGCDELGVAGAMQGSPIEIVKARTVDAHAIANAEYVIEGYLDTTQRMWESPLAEEAQKQGVFPFHPEWSGYMGKAYRTYKFVATAVTHRRDRPIYYPMIVHGYDDHTIDTLMRSACFLEMAERISPGFCIDVNIPMCMPEWGGVIFQVKKRRPRDEGYQKNILSTALSASSGMRLAIAVDTDVDIYSMDDIIWALTTRVDAAPDILIVSPGGVGQTFQPAERSSAGDREWTQSNIVFSGGIGLDATVPFRYRDAFERAGYPIERVDLKKWFSEEQIARVRSLQSEYARSLAKRGI
ncbi:MAG: UbiD family decarboxylase [Chloroflexi bacterium]|nr:UbiD family decarboxylase [Chloroflexota bacterium]